MKTLLVAVLLASFAASSARADECGGASPCEAYAAADAVFVGSVERATPESITMRQGIEGYDQTAYVTVERVYKGSLRERVVFRQLKRAGAPTFIRHSTYLFYANRDRRTGRWSVRACGRTRHAAYAQDDLRYLAGLPESAGRTRVAGEVTRYDADPDTQGDTERLASVRVTLVGKTGEYEATTDEHGVYEVYDLPPGEYRLVPRLPAGLRFFAALHYAPMSEVVARKDDLTFELTAGGCSGVTLIFTTQQPLAPDAAPKVGALLRRRTTRSAADSNASGERR